MNDESVDLDIHQNQTLRVSFNRHLDNLRSTDP